MREQGGRPSPGMCPRVMHQDGSEIAAAVTVLILEKDPRATTHMFRHILRRTHDPFERYQDGLRILASHYYQDPTNFSDVLTALFPADSAIAATLVREGWCELQFREGNQSLRIPCGVEEERPDTAAYQATYSHNLLFNPAPPPQVRVLVFRPHWVSTTDVSSDGPDIDDA